MITIALTGPESSGKTTLAEWLHKNLDRSILVEEYARLFLEENNLARQYSLENVLHIAHVQWKNIKTAQEKAPDFIISDTEQLVTLIWIEEVFKQQLSALQENFKTEKIDIYLLCKPDLPWLPDPLRENENDRDRLYELYLKALIIANKNFVVIEGDEENRERIAWTSIQKLAVEKSQEY